MKIHLLSINFVYIRLCERTESVGRLPAEIGIEWFLVIFLGKRTRGVQTFAHPLFDLL